MRSLQRLAERSCKPLGVCWNLTTARQDSISLKVLNVRFSFIVLQVLDLLTTLLAFHVGAFEVNPLIAHLIALFGRVGGVVLAKGIALILALGVRKRLWMANLFYVGVICWNLFVLVALAVRRH